MQIEIIKFFIDEPLIKKIIGSELNFLLNGQVSLTEPISEVDKLTNIEGSVLVPE
jgi:hypothetical protein